MITYKGHSISAEFRGYGVPPEQIVRRLAGCGTFATKLVGGFDSVDEALAAIDYADAVNLRHQIDLGVEGSHCGPQCWGCRARIGGVHKTRNV